MNKVLMLSHLDFIRTSQRKDTEGAYFENCLIMNTKVLLLQEIIAPYRVPVYNLISKKCDLTLAYLSKDTSIENYEFKSIKLDYLKAFGVYLNNHRFCKLCSSYDVIIFAADLHFLSFCILPFIRKNYKVIGWSIGFRSSYSRRYDTSRRKDLIDWLYYIILKKSDALIFYMKEPLAFWGNRIEKEKVFVAHNTVEVKYDENIISQQRDRLLFIGALYKEKGIYELLESLKQAKHLLNGKMPLMLDIVGGGPEYDKIKSWIMGNGLEDSISLWGPKYSEDEVASFFSKSILCISPDQAGLSVLKSMGYGVPFITRTNSITGGERYNIVHNVNGLFYNTLHELVNIIVDSSKNPEKYYEMGQHAREYYLNYATPEIMAEGVLDAINYVIRK